MARLDDAHSHALEAIVAAEDVLAINATLSDALALEGISACYFVTPLTIDARVGRLFTSLDNSPIWERHYRKYLHRIDPLPTFSLSVAGSFFWPDALQRTELDHHGQRYLEIARRYGLGRGIGVACYGPQGRNGFLGTAWPHKAKPHVKVLQWVNNVAQTAWQHCCQLVRMVETTPVLSNRELEVLSWMCEGKSNSVIAQILNISRSSVDMYVRRLFAKLEVTDRTAACVRGYTLGLVAGRDLHQLVERRRANPIMPLPS
ncbi:helix-turn-helix transcriptional regulator [Aurantiacibacter suaedae]|uniref:helix-turn-helix transcriptional regulator n=1 Tax=Aurantiacibacter suaedae TaxID=2545755 RepID=UPI001386F126|nr:LuxR family transcriptional regulator [Aurantiacibacter suaedae]